MPMVSDPLRRAAIEPHTTRGVRELLRGAIADVLDDELAFESWVGEALTGQSTATAAASRRML